MNRNRLSRFTGLAALFVLVLVCACDQGSGSVDAKGAATPTAPTAAKIEPTPERLAERSLARWQLIAKKDWIGAYDFLAPEQKQSTPIAQYVQGKANHEYTEPKIEEVIALEKDQGYVRASSLWTPHHPALAKVKLEPGQTLTERVDAIETWRFIKGDWYYMNSHHEEEFFQKHPNLLKKGDAKAPAPAAK